MLWHDATTQEPEHGCKCVCVVEQEGFGRDVFTLWFDRLRKVWYLQDIVYSTSVAIGQVNTTYGCKLTDKFNRIRVVKWAYAWEMVSGADVSE